MHQKHASFGFNTCSGDRAAMSAVTTPHRAVLATTAVSIAAAPHRDLAFETKTILLPSVFFVPVTPPPRLG
jgi:hypothetical protein